MHVRICNAYDSQDKFISKNTARIMIELHYAVFPGSAAGRQPLIINKGITPSILLLPGDMIAIIAELLASKQQKL